MNDAILPNLTTQSKPVMSSREIAQLCQKEHRHVLRDVDNLNATYDQMGLPKVGQGYYTNPNTGNQQHREYLLTKEQTIDLITGYRADVRILINRRWQQLENQTPQLPNFTDPVAAARAWADEVEAKQKALAELETARPKIAHYDNVVQRDGLLNATQVGQKVGLSALALNRMLDELGVYNKAVKRGRVFSQWVIDKGLGVIKQTEQGFSQALFTLKGEAWVIEKLTIEGVI